MSPALHLCFLPAPSSRSPSSPLFEKRDCFKEIHVSREQSEVTRVVTHSAGEALHACRW